MTTRQIASKFQIVVNIKKCLSLALDTLSSEDFTGPGAVAGTCPSGAHLVLTTLGYPVPFINKQGRWSQVFSRLGSPNKCRSPGSGLGLRDSKAWCTPVPLMPTPPGPWAELACLQPSHSDPLDQRSRSKEEAWNLPPRPPAMPRGPVPCHLLESYSLPLSGLC